VLSDAHVPPGLLDLSRFRPNKFADEAADVLRPWRPLAIRRAPRRAPGIPSASTSGAH